MERDERFYYDALGVEPEESTETGENEPDPADPAVDENELPPESIPAETVSDNVSDGDASGAEPEPEEDAGENEPDPAAPAEDEPPMSREERARQAAARRQAEREQAIQQARQEERDRIDGELKELFGWAGFKNGTAPIENLEQFKAYKQQADAAQLEKDLKAGKLTPEIMRNLVDQAVAARQTPAPPPVDPQAFQAQVDQELREIRKYDPSIQTEADLLKLDRFPQFQQQVLAHGHSYLDAYKNVYADKIAADAAHKAAAASAQRTRNAIRSKDHLRPAGSKGSGGELPTVPPEVESYYHQMMPKMTREEIARDYARYQKSK